MIIFMFYLYSFSVGALACHRLLLPLEFYFILFSKTESLTSRLEYSGAILAHCNLCILDSSDSPASVSQVAWITGMCHHSWLIFLFLVEMRFCHIDQAGLELLTLGDPSTLASQSARITGVSHCAQSPWWFLSSAFYLFKYFTHCYFTFYFIITISWVFCFSFCWHFLMLAFLSICW